MLVVLVISTDSSGHDENVLILMIEISHVLDTFDAN